MFLPLPPKSPVFKIISRPYEGKISSFKEKNDSIDRLSNLIHEVNPDYLLFHPVINSIQNVWLLASYGSLWLFGQFFFLIYAMFNAIIKEGVPIYYFYATICLIFIFITFFTAPFLTLKQLVIKKSRYNKVLLLKKTQQIAYYEHNRKQEPIFHLINYKDITASVRRNEGLIFEVLNLHVIDESTGELIHSISFEDMRLNPYDQWAFIRTYMERPAEELPLNTEYAQACPTDMSQSLFACADIAQTSKEFYDKNPTHEFRLADWIIRCCTISYLDLAEGNIYQSSANPALHPEVQRWLMWDRQNNPYNILPVTAERQAAFANQNQAVKLKWYSGIAVNATWFIGSILYVMLVIA